MTVKLAVAGRRVVGPNHLAISHAVRLTDSEGNFVVAAIKSAPKCLEIASAIKPKAQHTRARQIDISSKLDLHIRAQELLLVLWI